MQNSEKIDRFSQKPNISKGKPVGKIILSGLAAIFVVAVIAFSFLSFNYQNIERLNFPVSSSAEVCNIEFALSFPYLYIDLSSSSPVYRCVDACPSGWNQFIITDSGGEEIYCSSGEQVNIKMGGICWSAEKEAAMRHKGMLNELNYKESILGEFKSILIILVAAFVLSSAAVLLFYCLPQSINYFGSVAVASLLLTATVVMFFLQDSAYRVTLIVSSALIVLVFIVNVVCWREKLSESAAYASSTLQMVESASSFLLKSSLILLLFNILNIAFLTVVLFQLIALLSSEQQHRQDFQLFFTVEKVWWKYTLLFLEWFIVSHFIKELYTFTLVRIGCQINNSKQVQLTCCTLTNLLNIVTFSLLLAILWLPLRVIDLFKPNGAIIREREEETCCHRLTKAAYCCCGYFINKVHRYTFTPYLVFALDAEFEEIEESLRTVQEGYHRHDDRYDKSSLWIYRLSNYISIVILSILCMSLTNDSAFGLSSAHLLFFYLIAAVLAVEVSRLNMNFWSSLVEATEFIAITSPSA